MNNIRVNKKYLSEFLIKVFVHYSLPISDAIKACDVLLYADSRGVTTHGINNLFNVYLPKIKSGEIKTTVRSELIVDNLAIALIDAKDSLGLIVATEAMNLAIDKAKIYGVGCVGVFNSTHFGSAGYYSALASKQNQIGIALTNLGKQAVIKPFGAKHKLLGSNPISVSAPVHNLPDFNLDMSITVTSSGKIKHAYQNKQLLSEGLLFNLKGESVRDPSAYLNGEAEIGLLGGNAATGGHKGYGLGLMADILCGVLTGAAVGPNVDNINGSKANDTNIGHFFLSLDVSKFRDVNLFKQQLHDMLSILLNIPMHEGFSPLSYPGYKESNSERESDSLGINVDEKHYTELKKISDELKIPCLF